VCFEDTPIDPRYFRDPGQHHRHPHFAGNQLQQGLDPGLTRRRQREGEGTAEHDSLGAKRQHADDIETRADP